MPLISKDALYSDTNPGGPIVGQVLPEGHPDARFLLCGAGGLIPDDIAHRFDLDSHDSTSLLDEADERERLAAINRQTYADNARNLGGAHQALPEADPSDKTPTSKPAKGK